jgi:hypothetical protein
MPGRKGALPTLTIAQHAEAIRRNMEYRPGDPTEYRKVDIQAHQAVLKKMYADLRGWRERPSRAALGNSVLSVQQECIMVLGVTMPPLPDIALMSHPRMSYLRVFEHRCEWEDAATRKSIAVTSQPIRCTPAILKSLQAWGREAGLRIIVPDFPAWRHPTVATLIEITKVHDDLTRYPWGMPPLR